MRLFGFYWTRSCSWPLRSCFCSYKAENRNHFCIIRMHWGQSYCVSSIFQSFLYFYVCVYNAFLCVSLSLSASSRSPSRPTLCRQQGPPQSQVRGTMGQLSSFCKAERRLSLQPFMMFPHHRVVFDCRGTWIPSTAFCVSQRGQKEENCVKLTF